MTARAIAIDVIPKMIMVFIYCFQTDKRSDCSSKSNETVSVCVASFPHNIMFEQTQIHCVCTINNPTYDFR